MNSGPEKIIPFRPEEQFDMDTYGEGVLISKADRWSNVFACDPECTDASVSLEAHDPERLETAGHGSAVQEDGTPL